MKNLTSLLLGSMSEKEQYNLIPKLLTIPFPEYLNQIIKDVFPNPFLLLELDQKPTCATELKIQPEVIDQLFQQALLENQDLRRWAISSLVSLYKLELLDDKQIELFKGEFWRVTDNFGLLDGTDYYKFAFISLPHPEDIDPFQLFKNYITSTPFPILKTVQNKGISITRGHIDLIHEIIGASSNSKNFWTEDEATMALLIQVPV